MNRLRTLLESEIPLVAVSFRDNDSERLAKEAKSAGVDVAELRIDLFSRTGAGHVVKQVEAFRELPVLATVRAAHEGGGWTGGEAERLDLFRAVAPLVEAVDIELSSRGILREVIAAAREHDAVVIVSHHDFDRTPGVDALRAIVGDAKDAGADIVKISTMAESGDDVKRLAALLLDDGVNTDGGPDLIVIAMGATGAVSRVFFPGLGSRLTYSFIEGSSAPGQLRFSETLRLLRQFHPAYDRRKAAELGTS